MSEKDAKNLIHPVTLAIVQQMQRVNENLQQKKYVASLSGMRGAMSFMEAKDRDKKLFEMVSTQEAKIMNTVSNKQIRRSLRMSAPAYWRWFDQLNQLLYAKGYYSMEKWAGFHDPSKGRKS